MRSTKTFVYFHAVNGKGLDPRFRAKKWYLYTKGTKNSCFRDYSNDPVVEIPMKATDAARLLNENAHYSERVDCFHRVPVAKHTFWREQTELRENELRCPEKIGNLQSDFDEVFEESQKSADPSLHLESRIQIWIQKLASIKEKTEFNHWDNDDPSEKYLTLTSKGIGWTSRLLKNSRLNGRQAWIDTGDPRTDFSLLSMELSLGISSENNPFHKGRTDYIKPDGLGIRKNGHFTIFEVKGPGDETHFDGPLLQATCGALAIYAKRRMIVKIAKRKANRRPKSPKAEILLKGPSIGIHILMAAKCRKSFGAWWSEKGERMCNMLRQSFPQISYIAYSFIDHTTPSAFAKFEIEQSNPPIELL